MYNYEPPRYNFKESVYNAVFLNQPEKIRKSFKDNGLYPINRLVFSDVLFAKDDSNQATGQQNETANEEEEAESEPLANNIGKAAITIYVQPQNNVNKGAIPEIPSVSNPTKYGLVTGGSASGGSLSSDSGLKETLNGIRPLQNSTVKENIRKSRAKHSTHLTSTPELLKAKEKAEERARREEKKGAPSTQKHLNFSQAEAKRKGRPKKLKENVSPLINSPPYSSNPSSEVSINDWIVVKFPEEKSKVKNKKFLGKIVRIYKGRILVNFVRPKFTLNKSGFMYDFPVIQDKSFIKFNQILQKVKKPVESERGLLLFEIHHNVLKF